MSASCTPASCSRSSGLFSFPLLLLTCALAYFVPMFSGSLEAGVFMRTALRINYQELGFLKRGLVGSLIHALGLTPVDTTDLNRLAIAYGVITGLLLMVAATLLLRRTSKVWPVLAFLLSPAALIQFGATYNSFDGALAALLLCQVLLLDYDRLGATRPLLISLLGCLALLIHEIYAIAFLPLLLRLCLPVIRQRQWWILLSPIIFCLAALGLHGRYEPGQEALIARFGPGTSTLELTSTLLDNFHHTLQGLWLNGIWRFSLPGFLFLGVVLLLAVRSNPKGGSVSRIGARTDILFACSPMLLSIIGVDVNRWIALSFFNVLLLWVLGRIRFCFSQRWLAALLLPLLALAGPVGVNGLAFPRVTGPLYELYLARSR